MANIKDFTQGNLLAHLYRTSLPIMGGSFIMMAYSFTDMAWLGRLGSEAVAAVGTVSVFAWITNALASFGKTASEVTLAQAVGKGDHDEAKSYLAHIMSMSLVGGLSVMLIFLFASGWMVDLYLLEGVVRADALSYLYITLPCVPIGFMVSAVFGIYNATGNTSIPFRMLAVGLVANMVLDPLFIHVFGWGVAGAAWATLLSQLTVCIAFLLRFIRVDRFFGGMQFAYRLSWSKVWHITRIGLPASGLNVLFAIVSIYMGRLASSIGGHIGVGTLTTGGQLEALTWNTAQGVTTALTTIVGQCYAAGALDRVRQAFRMTIAFVSAVGLAGMLFYYFCGEDFFRLIVPERAAYLEGGVYLRIQAYSQIFLLVEIAIQGYFYGLGRSWIPAVISISGNYLRIPLALYFISLGWGLSAVWWAISITTMLKGLVSTLVYALLPLRAPKP